MPSPAKKKAAKEEAPQPAATLELSAPGTVLEQIERDIKLVRTDTLVPVYSTAKRVEKKITDLKSKIKTELMNRLDEAKPYGDQNQNRVFAAGDFQIKAEQRISRKLNEKKARQLVDQKGLTAEVVDLTIEAGAEELQAFLKRHRKEVAAMGLIIRESINADKFAALVKLHKITLQEAESCIDVGVPTYAFKD